MAGEVVVHSSAVSAFDYDVTAWVVAHRSAQLNAVMKTMTWLGTWVALAAGAILMGALVFLRRLPVVAAVLAILAWGGEALGVSLAKNVVQRVRPPKDIWLMNARGWSWPSGHAATAAVVFAVLAIVVTYLNGRSAVTWLAWIVAISLIAATGFSRIELGVHWTTDVLASFIFVAAWLVVMWATLGRPGRT